MASVEILLRLICQKRSSPGGVGPRDHLTRRDAMQVVEESSEKRYQRQANCYADQLRCFGSAYDNANASVLAASKR